MGVSKTTLSRWLQESSKINGLAIKPHCPKQQAGVTYKPKSWVQTNYQEVASLSHNPAALVSKNSFDQPVRTNKPNFEIIKRKRMRFDDDFRQRALIKLNSGLSVKKVARLVGVSVNTLNKWRTNSLLDQNKIEKLLSCRVNTVNQHLDSSGPVSKQIMRKHYDDQFKLAAIELIESGRSVRNVAKQLNVSELTLHRWWSQVNPTEERKLYSSVNQDTLDEKEVQQLNEELNRLEHERDLLRKSLSIIIELT